MPSIDTTKQIEYTPEELIKEHLWETEMIRKGRDAYMAALENADSLADTDIGMSLTMQITPAVIEAVKAKQKEHSNILLDGAGRNAANHLIPLADPTLLGVAMVQHFLRAILQPLDGGQVSLRKMLDHMESAFTEAMGLQLWEQDEPEEYAKFWNKEAERLSRLGNGNKSQRTTAHKRLKARINKYYEQFKSQSDDTQQVQLSVATELLSCIGFTRVRVVSEEKAMVAQMNGEEVMLVDYQYCLIDRKVGPLSDMFILRDHTTFGKEERQFYLSESAENTIDYTIERRAVGNVGYRPMLVKPKRWILTTA